MLSRRSGLVFAFLFALPLCHSAAQSTAPGSPLTIEEIVKLTNEKIPEDVIAAKIKKNGKAFDLSTEEIVEMNRLGVSNTIIKLLLDPTQPYLPPPPPKPAEPVAPPASPPKPTVPAKKYPDDKYATRVPPEPGLYRISGNLPAQMDIKLFLGQKQGAGIGKFVMKKGRMVGYLAGGASKNRVAEAAPTFYLRTADGKGTEDIVLVSLERRSDRRELDMGPPAPKPEFKPDAVRQFDSLEVGAGLLRITPAALVKGEYVFFLISTAEPAKGNYGKGYDFAVEPSAAVTKH